MSKIVSLLDRMEKWSVAYVSPCGDLQIKASNHGRFSFHVRGQSLTKLEFVESVTMLSSLSETMSHALESL